MTTFLEAGDELELARFTADYWQLEGGIVTNDLAFAATSINKFSSMRFFRFLAALEDTFKVRIPDPAAVTTYAALRAAVVGSADHTEHETRTAPSTATAPATQRADMQCGVRGIGHDMEEIASLPRADDYERDPFYTSQFTPREIEYCCRSKNPRQHFAARFCAKEAVRKCGPQFAALHPQKIEVVNSESGRPSIQINDSGFANHQFLVSLTHTEQFASAFVLAVGLE